MDNLQLQWKAGYCGKIADDKTSLVHQSRAFERFARDIADLAARLKPPPTEKEILTAQKETFDKILKKLEMFEKLALTTGAPPSLTAAPTAPSSPPETQPSPPKEPVAEPQGPSPTPPDVSETPSGPPDVPPAPPASGSLTVTHETVPAGTKRRRPSTITSLIAAQRMETYMDSKGLDFEDFGSIVGAAGKTLRSFANTGIIQRRIAKNVAIAMGTTLEKLLKSD